MVGLQHITVKNTRQEHCISVLHDTGTKIKTKKIVFDLIS